MTDKLFLLLGSSLGSSSHHRCSRHSSHHRCFGVILVVAGIGLLLAGGVEATLSTASSSTTKTTAFAHSSKKYRNVGEGLVSLSSKSSSLHGSKIPYGGTTTEDQDGSFVEGFTDDENLPTNTENIVSRTPSSIIADYCRGRGGATFKKTVVQGGGSASITNLIFNLVKNILGAGVLGLPAGIGAFGTTQLALIPSFMLIVIIGTCSAYCFALVGKVCSYTGATSYREAWERAVSPNTGYVPGIACILVPSCSTVAYSMILSETLPKLVTTITNGSMLLARSDALIYLTIFALLPLCLLKDLKSLAPFSLVGTIGLLYTCVAMAIRKFDGTYAVASSMDEVGGKFLEKLAPELLPNLASSDGLSVQALVDTVCNPNIFLLISMVSTAYMAHYNSPKYYWELKNNTLERFQTVVKYAFSLAFIILWGVASMGYLTFGPAASGFILNSYSTDDPLMSVSRIAVAVSLLCSYPLVFGGLRTGILDLLQVPKSKRTDKVLNTMTVSLLSVITCLAFVVTDLRKVLSFAGATWGNAVVYLIPCYMFVNCAKNVAPELQKEVPLVTFTGIIGLLLGIIGTVRAIQS